MNGHERHNEKPSTEQNWYLDTISGNSVNAKK